MANPSVSYTFTNDTTADATQVTQNFTDIINSLTDGTKSLTIDAITCAGTATFNGAVTLGNGTPDDITFTGSLASSMPIKTNNSFDIGSATLGLAGVYLGSAGGLTTRMIGGATGSSWTLTLPTTDGIDKQFLQTNGSGVTTWSSESDKYALAASVGSSALTIALKATDGNNPSAGNPVNFYFRNSTAATGTPVVRSITSALGLVVSSGSTLGTTSGNEHTLWVYAIDSDGAGTMKLGISQSRFDDGSLQTTVAEGGSGGADSPTNLYSDDAYSNVSIKVIGRLKSTQTVAGTWGAVPSEITVMGSQTTGPHSRLGEVIASISSIAPDGAIPANNKTIGKAIGDYQGYMFYALYAKLWALPGLSTSAGDPFKISSAKGASAVADWDAGKTIAIDFSTNELFIRQVGSTTTLGAYQADAFQGHYHSGWSGSWFIAANVGAGGNVGDPFPAGTSIKANLTTTGSPSTDGTNGTPRTAAETRPKNLALNMYIFYR